MTKTEFRYDIKVGVDEFHYIFGALQEKSRMIKEEIEGLISYDYDIDPYEEVVSDQEKYDSLTSQNKQINELLTRLYRDTDEQLKARNS